MISMRTNLSALNANRQLRGVMQMQSTAMERLASGRRLNRAADAPADMAIANRMRSQALGMAQASRNAQDGIGFLRNLEGAFGAASGPDGEAGRGVLGALEEIGRLLVQAGDGPGTGGTLLTAEQRTQITHSINQQLQIIAHSLGDLQLGGQPAFGGTTPTYTPDPGGDPGNWSGDFDFTTGRTPWIQTGANTGNGFRIGLETLNLGSLQDIDIDDLSASMGLLDDARAAVTGAMITIGTQENRLSNVIENLDIQYANITAAESRIMDADVAMETLNLMNAQVRQQAIMFMFAQANSGQETLLRLLGF